MIRSSKVRECRFGPLGFSPVGSGTKRCDKAGRVMSGVIRYDPIWIGLVRQVRCGGVKCSTMGSETVRPGKVWQA